MNTLQQLSFLYPNAVAVAGILIAFAVIYFAGKALAWVFSSTEKKVEPEPSIMTELDELRRANERLSTMYDQLAYNHDVLGHECDVLSHEFDTYKKDAQEVHDKLIKLYEAEVATKEDLSSKLWHSRREVGRLKRDLISATAQIAELGSKYNDLQVEFEAHKATAEELNRSYINEHNENYERMMKIEQLEKELEFLKNRKPIGWIAADADEAIYSHGNIEKGDEHWMLFSKELTSKEAIAICGRVPQWSDNEPTPIYQ